MRHLCIRIAITLYLVFTDLFRCCNALVTVTGVLRHTCATSLGFHPCRTGSTPWELWELWDMASLRYICILAGMALPGFIAFDFPFLLVLKGA